ncbi:fimbrial biogenesis outer membrane usher protein [Pantoea alhagi]|uniref:fimbria/pilus outer membrane usher protein n=1 Tax=Pantoea alhagi TaxID=1891675 RepID=UPI00202B5B55|nr:fimbria/pilus outer membrane usher protein [Pantoea alhagi]URQ61291.1 fimbrial biogenesis outer membrane usher protein [Pantoea alhagi]
MAEGKLRHLLLPCMITAVIQTNSSYAVTFNPALLERHGLDNEAVDLSAFENNLLPPGTYRVEVVVNNQPQETRDVSFRWSDSQDLMPCLSVDDLARYDVNIARYPELQQSDGCADLTQIHDAAARLDVNAQRLLLSIPQAALQYQARETVPPEQWDNGINALLLNYRFSGAHSEALEAHHYNSDSQFLSLRPGLNIGPWRVRNYSTWSRSRHRQGDWNNLYTLAQREIVPLQAQLTLGESSSPSDMYDSVNFRGVQLASDEDMLPDSLRGYAPVVRGIARSHAQVNVYQNGQIIYQTYVAPGAFAIADIYPTGGSGDLTVTINEADGSEQQLVVPFASVPVLQREGHIKYSITGGEYRGYGNHHGGDLFFQATGIIGLPQAFTLYGGTQQAENYRSLVAGVGKNLGSLGALSLDATLAHSQPAHQDRSQGHAWRLRYGKNFINTGTSVALAGYRYATSGFYSLNDVMESDTRDRLWQWDRRRQRAELTLTQSLWPGAGSLTLSAIKEEYWDNQHQTRSLNLGYNNSWQGISVSLNYSYNRNTLKPAWRDKSAREDQVLALSLSVPLSRWADHTWANYQMNSARHGSSSHSAGLSGTALADHNLSWSLRQGYTSRNEGSSGSGEIDFRGAYGEADAGYAWDRHSRRLSYGLSGALVAHRDGITLSQPLGETVALVKAPGIANASVLNQTGVSTDFRGYTLVPYLRAYRISEIMLDPLSLPDTVELQQTTQQVVPTRGAVVRADFSGRVGERALVTLIRRNGLPVPFGATVTLADNSGDYSSIVGDNGEVWLSGLSEQVSLQVSWGSRAGSQCRADFTLPEERDDIVTQLQTICQ